MRINNPQKKRLPPKLSFFAIGGFPSGIYSPQKNGYSSLIPSSFCGFPSGIYISPRRENVSGYGNTKSDYPSSCEHVHNLGLGGYYCQQTRRKRSCSSHGEGERMKSNWYVFSSSQVALCYDTLSADAHHYSQAKAWLKPCNPVGMDYRSGRCIA